MSYPDRTDLDEVNAACNALPYVADPANFDDWSPIDDKGGDCDSYAVGKLRHLVVLGWPIATLRLACCYVETPPPDNYHAVLAVDLPDGQIVLDNRQNHPVTLTELRRIGYTPDRIQKVGGSQTWVRWEWF